MTVCGSRLSGPRLSGSRLSNRVPVWSVGTTTRFLNTLGFHSLILHKATHSGLRLALRKTLMSLHFRHRKDIAYRDFLPGARRQPRVSSVRNPLIDARLARCRRSCSGCRTGLVMSALHFIGCGCGREACSSLGIVRVAGRHPRSVHVPCTSTSVANKVGVTAFSVPKSR
jgi:hypothetical protein